MERMLRHEQQSLTVVKNKILNEVRHVNTTITDHTKSRDSIRKQTQSHDSQNTAGKGKGTLTT